MEFSAIIETLLIACVLGMGGALFGFFKKMSSTQKDLCETVAKLQKTIIILAKALDRQTNRMHPDEAESDLDDLVKELLDKP
ncbi:MAG: hypothetical protein MUQ75_11055 [Crocinitomicaceae bacterium]|nr:hypothetical protein [Crocinitomicaceae bacterium]